MTKTFSDIVVSLEIAKKLKEAGMPQVAICNYVGDTGLLCYTEYEKSAYKLDFGIDSLLSAPTAEDLLEYIPEYIQGDENTLWFRIVKHKDSYQCGYLNILQDMFIHHYRQESLSNALGFLLIWLVENGYVKFTK